MAIRKNELAQRVAEEAGLNKAQANRAVDAVIGCITDTLKQGDTVNLTGFGTFSVTQTSQRTGRNPRTKETINIPAGKRPSFKAGSGLKQAVSGK